jgi:class 3 adenylate cyclase/CHASE2 domain-containing sensor protein
MAMDAQPPRLLQWVLALGLACALVPFLSRLDLAAFDAQSRMLRRQAPSPAPEVVLIGLDEATVAAYAEPMALWHGHLGAVLAAVALGRPRAMGLDINLPNRSFDAFHPGLDRALLQGLLTARKACPVVLGVTVEGDGQARGLYAPFVVAAGGQEALGLVQWRVDEDRVVRRFTEWFPGQAQALPTLVGQLGRQLGVEPREGLLDFRPGGVVPSLSLREVEAWGQAGEVARLRHAFEGRVVLLGTVLPFEDRHHQVVDLNGWGEDNRGYAPGVLLHVQALRNLLGTGFIREVPWPLRWLLLAGMVTLGWGLARRTVPGLGWLGVALSLLGVVGIVLQAQRQFLPPVAPALGLLCGFLVPSAWLAVQKLRERRRLRSVFGGYVSPSVLTEILAGRLDAGFQGQKHRLCVLFSDVRGFTTLSEGRAPEDIIALLNRYFERMAPAVHAAGGTVVSYIGDGMMAHFGHPEALENPCRAAFTAGQAMLAALAALNAEFAAEGLPALQIGIGLHVGDAVVGHIGSKERHEYTAIGDTVNVAARVEGLSKDTGYPLIVTAAVAAALVGEALVPLGPKPIKGHTAIEVFGWRP